MFSRLPCPPCFRRPKRPGCWKCRGILFSRTRPFICIPQNLVGWVHDIELYCEAAGCVLQGKTPTNHFTFQRIFGIILGRLDAHMNGFHLWLTLLLFFFFLVNLKTTKMWAAIIWKRGATEHEGHLLPGWLSFTKWRCYFCVWKWDSTAADSGLHYPSPFPFLPSFITGFFSHCSSTPETDKKEKSLSPRIN